LVNAAMTGLYARSVRAGLRAYKLTLSPYIGQACRFSPTCSEYTAQAMIEHGPLKGTWLGVRRICRCRPGGGSGQDLVPPRT
jgi:putative membrane protein insertion efficiency factor